MTGFFIVIGLVVLAVAVVAVRHDRRQRGFTAHQDGRAAGRSRNLHADNHAKADEWGGPPS